MAAIGRFATRRRTKCKALDPTREPHSQGEALVRLVGACYGYFRAFGGPVATIW